MTQPFAGFPAETVNFLNNLKANNNREWFQANKKTYDLAVKLPAQQFCAEMSDRLTSLTGQQSKSKVFRISRDLRFSKDKTPYNTHLHISFIPQGRKSPPPCWFFGLSPDYLSLGTGLFAFDKTALQTYRTRVDGKAGEDLAKVLAFLTSNGARLNDPDLKRVPSSYPQDHPRADLLRRKGLAAWRDLTSPAEASKPDLIDECMMHYKAMKPVFDWLSDVTARRP